MDYEKLDFEILFQLVKQNDQQALAELIFRFEPLIKSESRFHERLDEDIAQDIREIFVKVLQKKIAKF